MLQLLIIAVIPAVIFGLFGFTRISAGFMGIARRRLTIDFPAGQKTVSLSHGKHLRISRVS